MTFSINYNPIEDLNEKYDNSIHLYKINTNGRKCITIVKGLQLSNEEEKNFTKKMKQVLSTNGYKKKLPEYGSKEVICFFGDKRNEIRDFIKTEYKRSDDTIIVHG